MSSQTRRTERKQGVSGRLGNDLEIVEAQVLVRALVGGKELNRIQIRNVSGGGKIVSAARSEAVGVRASTVVGEIESKGGVRGVCLPGAEIVLPVVEQPVLSAPDKFERPTSRRAGHEGETNLAVDGGCVGQPDAERLTCRQTPSSERPISNETGTGIVTGKDAERGVTKCGAADVGTGESTRGEEVRVQAPKPTPPLLPVAQTPPG